MHSPDELLVQAFLPAMRQLVALRLRSRGLSQGSIALLLGVTQASVSLYLSAKPAKSYSQLAAFSVPKEDADSYSSELAESVLRSTAAGVATLDSIWTSLLGNGSVCSAHRALYPSLADCDYCLREYGSGQGRQFSAVSEVADAVKLLEASTTFPSVMPKVSVNVACTAGEASSPADIVAVPGRIVKVRGRAKAMLPPEAGASMHMSRMLLLVRKARPEIRACINLRYDERIAGILRGLGLRPLVITAHSHRDGDDPTADALQRSLRRSPGRFDVVVDKGGGGIEPNVYILAKGAREAATLALEISMRYSAR